MKKTSNPIYLILIAALTTTISLKAEDIKADNIKSNSISIGHFGESIYTSFIFKNLKEPDLRLGLKCFDDNAYANTSYPKQMDTVHFNDEEIAIEDVEDLEVLSFDNLEPSRTVVLTLEKSTPAIPFLKNFNTMTIELNIPKSDQYESYLRVQFENDQKQPELIWRLPAKVTHQHLWFLEESIEVTCKQRAHFESFQSH